MLSAVMLKVQVAADHFVKVRGLIKDLISKLNAEQKQSEMDIADLQATIAENTKALAEATELRNTEKAENEKTVNDATEGKEATELALSLLEGFYGSALVQYVPPDSDREGKTVGDRAPEVFDGEYHGQQSASKGIIGILEVIVSDFENTVSKTEQEETEAAEAFQDFSDFIKESNEGMEKEVKAKDGRISEIGDEKVDAEIALKSAQKMLASAKEELEKLQPMCVDGDETYAERVAKRQKEIDALKEAMELLDNWQN